MSPPNSLDRLPVQSRLLEIVAQSRRSPLIVVSPPGSGKSTLIPPAIVDDLASGQRLLLIQPRRLAARAIAGRIAHLRNSPLGQEVGYQVRFENRTSAATRIVVATTGILLRRLAHDLTLSPFDAVILDEFHERTIELDLSLGMLWRLRKTLRPELRILIASATIDPAPISRLLDGCPVIECPGRVFPVDIRYARRRSPEKLEIQVGEAIDQAAQQTDANILVFLPGVGEIHRCHQSLSNRLRERFDIFPLYGDLPADQQDRCLMPGDRRKIILATNIAETSLTIDGVTAVVDSGLARQRHTDPSIGLPRLELVPISKASADQRAGRAARVAPGICWRLWEMAAHAARPDAVVPEIRRDDFAAAALFLLHWGEKKVEDFPWLDPPYEEAVQTAFRLLSLLGAIDGARTLTEVGRAMIEIPAHPRMARLLISGKRNGVLQEMSLAAALLTERDPFRVHRPSRTGDSPNRRATKLPSRRSSPTLARKDATRLDCDLLERVEQLSRYADSKSIDPQLSIDPAAARNVLRVARQLHDTQSATTESSTGDPSASFRRSLLDGFADRVARLRSHSGLRALMVGGKGVQIDSQSQVRPTDLFVCVDLSGGSGDATARSISTIERSWLSPEQVQTNDELFFNPTRQQVEARRRTYYVDLLLEETPTQIEDLELCASLLAKHAVHQLDRFLPETDHPAQQLRRRVQWIARAIPEQEWPDVSDEAIGRRLPEFAVGLRSIDQLRRLDWLTLIQLVVGPEKTALLERLAPAMIPVPSGTRTPVIYHPGRPPHISVRIQELFGMASTPRIAGGRVAVVLELLGPNYRPVQKTDDLQSFWKNTYPEVKKELRRRYPKHAWPDDPATAVPTRSGLSRDQRKS